MDLDLYKQIVDGFDDALMVIGTDGKILLANDALVNLTGYSHNELAGAACTVLNCDGCSLILSKDSATWRQMLAEGYVRNKRSMMYKKDGSFFSVMEDATLLRNQQGDVIGVLERFSQPAEGDHPPAAVDVAGSDLIVDESFHGMIGQSSAMLQTYRLIERAAETHAPVIIYGDSGTGKELAARAIHQVGKRNDGPFIHFNCAALNESLLESELFGHVKGAFTGAYRHRKGRFEAAHGGDIFLDEIGDIPLSTQAKLLRVLETNQFERVGDHRPIDVDVRIISATNRNLQQLIQQGKFRHDLFFRINVIPIYLPPLKERKEDIHLLVKFFVEQLRASNNQHITGVSPNAMRFFMQYAWPGNVRELKSALSYAFVVAESGLIEMHHLPGHFQHPIEIQTDIEDVVVPTSEVIGSDEKRQLINALRQTHGNKTKAAKILGVHRMTVWNRMRKYNIHLKKDVIT
jgi:PAS domain S-box-containing protein